MTLFEKIVIVLQILIILIVIFLLYKLIRYWVIEWQAGRDRSANLFDKAELNIQEERNLKKWVFSVPDALNNWAISNSKKVAHDTFTYIQFTHGMSEEDIKELRSGKRIVEASGKADKKDDPEDKLILLKSAVPLPNVNRFRYFEVEVLENAFDSDIYIAIVNDEAPFVDMPQTVEEIASDDSIIIYGKHGELKQGTN